MDGNKKVDNQNQPNNKVLNRDDMNKAIEIIKSSPDGNLTEDQIKELEILGMDENMIASIKNGPGGNMNEGNNKKSKTENIGN